jgi:hypothetical protein
VSSSPAAPGRPRARRPTRLLLLALILTLGCARCLSSVGTFVSTERVSLADFCRSHTCATYAVRRAALESTARHHALASARTCASTERSEPSCRPLDSSYSTCVATDFPCPGGGHAVQDNADFSLTEFFDARGELIGITQTGDFGGSRGGETPTCAGPGTPICGTARREEVVLPLAVVCDGGACPTLAERRAQLEEELAKGSPPGELTEVFLGVIGHCPDGSRFVQSSRPSKTEFFTASGQALGREQHSPDGGLLIFGEVPKCPSREMKIEQQVSDPAPRR